GPRPGAGRRAPTQGSQHLRGRPLVTRHSAAIPEKTGSGQERNRRRGPTARYVGRTMARTRTSPGAPGLGVASTASQVAIALRLLALVVVGLLNVWNPFGTTSVDRSGPAVLDRIRTLEEFAAAEANFPHDGDLESDNFRPGFIK